MIFKEITSQDNAIIKKISKLKNKKYRDEFGEFMAEGRLSLEAGLSSCYELSLAVASKSFAEKNEKYLEEIKNVIVTSDRIFEQISDAVTPQGIMGIFKISNQEKVTQKAGKHLIYCDNLRDPGNAGTIIRTADALGMDAVIFSKGSADIYAPKLVRSTMGSLFHVSVYRESGIDDLEALKMEGYKVISLALGENCVSIYDFVCPQKCVFVVGNEAHGVSEEVLGISDVSVKIPMYGFAESLNASVAAAIVMNEAARSLNYGK